MSREVTLAVPQSIEAAYLVIIGQVALLFSHIVFEVLSFIALGNSVANDLRAIAVLLIALLFPFILMVNVVSCWLTTRSTFDEFEEYPNSLFAWDIIMIVLFFSTTNLVTLAFISGDTSQEFWNYLLNAGGSAQPINSALESLYKKVVNVVPPAVFFMCGLVCATYIAWNKTYLREKKRILNNEDDKDFEKINSILFGACAIQVAFCCFSIIFDAPGFLLASVLIWSSFWIWINITWLKDSPLSPQNDL